VVDVASRNAAEQHQEVEKILAELKLSDKPIITALNKIDLLLSSEKVLSEREAMDFLADRRLSPDEKNTVLISATKAWGLNKLLELINQMLQ